MTINPQRVQAIYLAALEISDLATRRELLDQECAGDDALRRRVDELINAHDDATQEFGDQNSEADFVVAVTKDSVAMTGHGTVLSDRYKLIEAIGEGGMGSVWLAEQKEPVKRKVAIKLVKAGMDSQAVLARFEAERQALAVMDHPHIAKVLDGGTTPQGRPYFVMELVKGIPLTDYCDQTQLAVPERLVLFNQVCSAVQHAHQKGIIHRDLKPSNILVTEYDGRPVCKVIDFGLAKAIQGAHTLTEVSMHTAFGAVVGTPLYMAPEQLGVNGLDIDTRADLYSLGVILYELLTGSTPIEKQRLKRAALDEIMRIVREEEPAIPSHRLSSSDTLPSVAARRHIEPARLTKMVRGDLDWIVMKALEKNRNRRYETANGLSLDIQRYLAGEAVLAAPPSGIYRLRKFVRKHRVPVVAASLLALSLIGGIIGTSIGFYNARISAIAERDAKLDAQNKQAEAERARIEAELARNEAEQARNVAEDARNDAISQKTRAEAREGEAIDAVRRFGESVSNNRDLKNNPSLESLRKTLLQEPLAFFESLRTRLQADPHTTKESLDRLAVAACFLGKLTDEIGDKQNAIKAYEQSLAIYERMVREYPTVNLLQRNLADCHFLIGSLWQKTGKPAEAFNAYKQALEIRQRLVSEHPTVTEFQRDLATSYNHNGILLAATGQPAEAVSAYRQALEIQKRLANEHPAQTEFRLGLANIHNNHAFLLHSMGKLVDALKVYEQALEIRQRLVQESPADTELKITMAASLGNIGILYDETGQPAAALTAFEQAMEIQKQLVSEHPSVTDFQRELVRSHLNLGRHLDLTGKPSAALESFQQGLVIGDRLARENPTVTGFQSLLATSHNSIGNLLYAQKEIEGAFTAYTQALAIQKRLADENPTATEIQSDYAGTLNNVALIEIASEQFASARDRLREAVDFQKRALATNINHPTYRQFLDNHYSNMIRAADGLHDLELRLEAERGLAELKLSDPSRAKTEERIDAILDGEKEKSSLELMQLGTRANETMRYGLAVKLWRMAFERYPELLTEPQKKRGSNAARAAILAAERLGIDDPQLTDEESNELRNLALKWLNPELVALKNEIQSGSEIAKARSLEELKKWLSDEGLKKVQAEKLESLPEPTKSDWKSFWAEVEMITSPSN
ncbi:MAG: protein kinase [Planctomycetaceae bacterium]|nr:protein kinase [Planctomycetaceae bacterium]